MMLGELDFVGTYVNTYYRDQLKVPMTSFLILSKYTEENKCQDQLDFFS